MQVFCTIAKFRSIERPGEVQGTLQHVRLPSRLHSAPSRTSGSQARADVKEAFDIGLEVTSCDPGDPAARMRSQNLWPVDLKEFRETVSEYFSQALVLSNTIFAILSTALGLPSDFFVGLRMIDQLIGLMMLGFKAQLIRESNPP